MDGTNCCSTRTTRSNRFFALTSNLNRNKMKTRNHIDFPESLSDLYNHPDFIPFGSSSDDWLHDQERMERCHDAADDGADGSTHWEVMQDWKEFLNRLESEATSNTDWHPRVTTEIERRANAIREEIEDCRAWHEGAGSLHEMVG